MLTRFFLQFTDDDLNRRFKQSRQEFYQKALPIIALMLFLLAITLEVLYRGVGNKDLGKLSVITSVINWGYVVIFILKSFLIRRFVWPSWIVCPLITWFVYYYFSFVDFQKSAAVLYFTIIIALTTAFFFVVVFNESWLFSTAAFIIAIVVLMKRIGMDLLGE